jgi:PleD family two-component response regulator
MIRTEGSKLEGSPPGRCLLQHQSSDFRSTHDNRHLHANLTQLNKVEQAINMKSIPIADDNRFIRRCIPQVLEEENDFKVCGEAENGREAIEIAQRLRPDAVLLDFVVPVMNGLDAAREISRSVSEIRLILFSLRLKNWPTPCNRLACRSGLQG